MIAAKPLSDALAELDQLARRQHELVIAVMAVDVRQMKGDWIVSDVIHLPTMTTFQKRSISTKSRNGLIPSAYTARSASS